MPIIFLTVHGNISEGVKSIENVAFDYLTKGDDNPTIVPLIAEAMAKVPVAYLFLSVV